MSGEIGHVALLLHIPDFHLGIFGAGAENQTVRMELGRSQSDFIDVHDLRNQTSRFDIGKRPMFVRRSGQQIVAGRMQR